MFCQVVWFGGRSRRDPTILAAVEAFSPAAIACYGFNSGIPKAVATDTNRALDEIRVVQVCDGQWHRYASGSVACGGQGEGKK